MMPTPNLTQEENFDQAIKVISTSVEIDPVIDVTTRRTTMIVSKITERYHHTSQTKTNPGIGEVTITIHNCLQCREKINPSRFSAVNSDQFHLIPQCSADLETKTRTKIYPTTGISQFLTTATSQTWFDSLQQTKKIKNYRDYAP